MRKAIKKSNLYFFPLQCPELWENLKNGIQKIVFGFSSVVDPKTSPFETDGTHNKSKWLEEVIHELTKRSQVCKAF